jgi:hypothetical protein
LFFFLLGELFFFFIFDLIGVCTIPLCSFRTPLEGHLCRVGPNDECFALNVPGTTDQVCVPTCPDGTEEEHVDGVSTGL